MADISKDDLRKEITGILKSADLTSMSAKKVRQQIEEKLDVDLTERKKEIDDLVMECLQEKTDSNKKSKKKPAAEESEDGEEEEEEEEEEASEEEEEEEEEKKPAKRAAQTKAKKPVKRKKGSSDEDESASGDEDASDEDYKPKKAKSSPKKGKKGKKKDGESDSDSDWGKNKKGAKKGAGAKKGGRKGGGGYTRAITLTPELAAVVGAKQLPRHEVVKKIWSIIKEKNLYDPKNKQYAICDDELMKIFGVKRFRTFGMMKYLKNHFVD